MDAVNSRPYPARLMIDYSDRDLDRVSTMLRLVYAIPIVIVAALVGGSALNDASGEAGVGFLGGGILVAPTLLMILFRQKYPRWWFDFNLQLVRFSTRVTSYMWPSCLTVTHRPMRSSGST